MRVFSFHYHLKSVFFFTVLVCFSNELLSREIIIKYRRDAVDISSNFVEYDLQESSLVKELFFDSENQYLIVRLKQHFYHYCGVRDEVVNDWINSESLGTYYLTKIKTNYDCRIKTVPNYID